MAPHIYLGQWEWSEDAGTGMPPCWHAPGGTNLISGAIDLRNSSQQRFAGGSPQGFGLFIYEGPQTHPLLHVDLGDDISGTIRNSALRDIRDRMGPFLGGLRRPDVIFRDYLVNRGDAAGVTAHKPFRGSVRQGVKIKFGAFGNAVDEVFDEAHQCFQNHIDVFQEDYRRERPKWSVEVREKVVGHKLLSLYKRLHDDDAQILLPPEFLTDGHRQPQTEFTESFNQVDSSTLGPDLSWTEQEGDFETLSNELSGNNNGFSFARADSDLSSDDNLGEIDVLTFSTGGDAVGPTCRHSASAVTFYQIFLINSGTLFLRKEVSSTPTNLDNVSITYSLPELYRVEADGSTQEGFQAGVSRVSASDTEITGHVRCGVMDYFKAGTSDDFRMADLAAGGTILPFMIQMHG